MDLSLAQSGLSKIWTFWVVPGPVTESESGIAWMESSDIRAVHDHGAIIVALAVGLATGFGWVKARQVAGVAWDIRAWARHCCGTGCCCCCRCCISSSGRLDCCCGFCCTSCCSCSCRSCRSLGPTCLVHVAAVGVPDALHRAFAKAPVKCCGTDAGKLAALLQTVSCHCNNLSLLIHLRVNALPVETAI